MEKYYKTNLININGDFYKLHNIENELIRNLKENLAVFFK